MKRSFFDIIFLGFLFLFVSVFFILVFYSSNTTRRALIEEKADNLTNEAFLFEPTITGYVRGFYTKENLQESLTYYATTLDSSIWFVDPDGKMVASAQGKDHAAPPENIFLLNWDFNLNESQTFTGDFYGVFEDDVITVAIPVLYKNELQGMVFLHSTVSQLKNMQRNIVQAMYVPFLIMIIVSFLLLGLISQKIMRPIRKINSIAEEYATGNFDSPMNVKSKDEIGQLASTLEFMASELSKLDEYRRAFISNISHDFRSPLTSIKGYIEAILDGTIPPEKQERYLNIVVDETQHLSKLTASLLELNDFDSYGIWLMYKEFDVVDLVRVALNTFEGKCSDKGITLVLNNHTDNSVVKADKTKIQQVVYNLLDNAIKFTPAGKSIYVTLTERNDKIFISIKDEGCGIPADSLSKIWVRFYKADISRGRDKQGTGLGLAITKEIIKAHNENINVVSTEGVGSEFTFSLQKVVPEKTDKTENITNDQSQQAIL